MIAETTLLLVIIALFSSIRIGVKVDKIFSFITFTSVFLLFMYFYNHSPHTVSETFSFIWNSSASGDINVSITTNHYNCLLIFPFFAITLLSIGNNLIFRHEERRNACNAALLFNLSALIMMITSNNFVQLLSALFIIDIIAAILIKDIENSKTYVFQNLLADMLLFTVLAIINGQVDTYDIEQILHYRQNGEHLDFVAILGLSAVFLKAGLFPFQSGILALQNIRFHRLQNIIFLTSGISAFILLLKFHSLWNASAFFGLYLDIICFLSLLWGCAGLILIDNLKAKVIYMMLMVNALIIELLYSRGFTWSAEISSIMISTYILSDILYFIHYYTEHRTLISQYGNPSCITQGTRFATILFATLNIGIITESVDAFGKKDIFLPATTFLILFLLGFSNMLAQITAKKKKMPTPSKSIPQTAIIFWLAIAVATSSLFAQTDFLALPILITLPTFILLVFLKPLSFSKRAYTSEKIQQFDKFTTLYRNIILEPLYFCGRILWLLIDWILVEKFIIGALTFSLQILIRLFRRLHNNRIIGISVVTAILTAALIISFHTGGK